jgi:hypothetical protein
MINKVGGSNGKVVCPRNTAGDRTKKRREYPPKQDSAKHNDKQIRGIEWESSMPAEYSRRQDKETAGIPA